MARYISNFTGQEIDNRLSQVDERWGSAYFDPTTYRWLGFKNDLDKATYLATGDESLIVGVPVQFSFSGTVTQLKIINEMPSGTLYFTTKETEAYLTCSFLSQEKGITDSAWTDVIEDFNVSVAVDRGGTGEFADLIVEQLVLNGNSFTFDVRNMLASGSNRVRVVAKGVLSGASASFTYTVNLTSMYLSPSNFTWYTPFIEGATYNLGGMFIGGNLQKVLKIKVAKEGYEKLYEENIGKDTYTSNVYVYRGLQFPEAGTGIYNVELWLDANGLESEHLKYNIIFVSQADKYTAQLISVSEQPSSIYNFTENTLFKYSIYNRGEAMGTPHVKVTSIVKATPTVLIEEDLVNVETGKALDYTVAIEIETEEADVQVDATIAFGNEQEIIYAVDNSKSFPATTGTVFYINPAIRSNAQDNKHKIINAVDSKVYDAVFNYMAWTDGTDGWTTDDGGRRCLRLPAGSTCDIPYQPFVKMTGSKTIEFTYKVENAADYEDPIISICDDPTSDDFRGIRIFPKEIQVHSRDLKDTELQNYKPEDEETLNVIITIVPNYKTNYGNLVKIWVNGSPVREFSFESNDSWLHSGNIKLGSQTADLFLYKLRVYESSFGFQNAIANFLNSLPTAKDKQAALERINSAIDDSYKLDYDACVKSKINTMVIEMLDGAELPSLAHPTGGQANIWINIHNLIEGELDEQMAQLLTGMPILNQTLEGQGTTAMTYAVWNLRTKMDSTYWKRRITAKKNFASSMQSHKMGATRMFNHLHKAVVGPNEVGRDVAVSQYPVITFLKVKIEGTVDQYNYVPLGLYTVGADKGDKPTFGFDNKTYKNTLIHLEGADHTPMAVGFDYPWSATKFDASKEAMGAIGNTGDVVAAWEVGAAGDYETDSTADQANVQSMLDSEFQPAYNVAYHNSPHIVGVVETLEQINADIAGWRRKTTTDGKRYSMMEFYTVGNYDLYYYNTQRQRYELTGVNVLTDLGLSDEDILDMTIESANEFIKDLRRARFKAEWGNYWNTDDSIFHYTFCMIFGATDNFKKNTYPYKFALLSGGGRWRWRADDLDTIFDINNQGLAAKAYSILVGDQTATGSGSIYRGDTSVFFTLIKETCQDEIKAMVHRIFNAMVAISPYGNNTLDKIVGCIKKFFWDFAQEYFPISAYNNDAELTYEDSWAAGLWKEVNPLSQSLGGHYEAERDWVKMRVLFMASYYNYGPFGTVNDSFSDTSTGQMVYGGAGQHTFEVTPAIDFNPTALRGQSELVTVGERVRAGQKVELTIPDSSGADTRIYVQGVDWVEDIGDLSTLQVSADNPTITVQSKRLQTLKLGDENPSNVTSNIKTLTMGSNPSMMMVDARNLTSLTGNIDLSKLPRLRQALFGGTNVRSLGIANGSKVERLQFGEGTTSLTLRNLKFLESLELEDKSKIEFFRVENCDGLNPFELLREAYNLDSQVLKDIRIIGFITSGDTADVDMLANFANDLDKNGNEHPYNGIDSEGVPMQEAHPVIEGTLSIAGSVYEDSASTIRANYPNLTLIVEGGYYIRFADPVVAAKMSTQYGDGTGMTVGQAEALTRFPNLFQNNTEITSFEEGKYFPNITYWDQSFRGSSIQRASFKDARMGNTTFEATFYQCTNLEEIDFTNAFKGIDTVVGLVNTFGSGIKRFIGLTNCTLKLSEQTFRNLTNLEELDLSEVKVQLANASALQYCFNSCTSLRKLNISNWNLTGQTFSISQFCGGNTSLTEIIGLDSFTGAHITRTTNMFQRCSQLAKIDGMSGWDMSQCTEMVNMFSDCTQLMQDEGVVDLSTWSSGEGVVVNCSSMFANDTAITHIILGSIRPNNMASAFSGCSSLTSIDISRADMSECVNIDSMFAGFAGEYLDLSSWTTDKITSGTRPFTNVKNLKHLVLSDQGWGGALYGLTMYGSLTNLERVDGWFNGINTSYFFNMEGCTKLRKCEIRNLGGHQSTTSHNFNSQVLWGINSAEIPDAQQSLVSTFNHVYDRASAGYSACTITLSANSLASLEEGMGDVGMWNVLQKGYTVANYSPYITFEDPIVASICATNWGDGTNIAKAQAAEVTNFGDKFKGNTDITAFPEIEKFTGLQHLYLAFEDCENLEGEMTVRGDFSSLRQQSRCCTFAFYKTKLTKLNLYINFLDNNNLRGFAAYVPLEELDLSNCTFAEGMNISGCSDFASQSKTIKYINMEFNNRVTLTGFTTYGNTALTKIRFVNADCTNQWLTGIEGATSLHTIEVVDCTFNNVTLTSAFPASLTTITGVLTGWKVALNLSKCVNLTHDSIMNVINGLADLTDSTAQTLTLGSTNLAKLSDTEKAIAVNKNWTLA